MPVVGIICEVPLLEPLTAPFRRAMAELGYVEGKNVAAEYRMKLESLPQAAVDLVRLNVNVIFAAAPAALAAVSKTTTSIPVVGIDLESDPVAKGYVEKSWPARAAILRECFLISRSCWGNSWGCYGRSYPGSLA